MSRLLRLMVNPHHPHHLHHHHPETFAHSRLAALKKIKKGVCQGYSVIRSRCKYAGEIIHSLLSDSRSCLPAVKLCQGGGNDGGCMFICVGLSEK